MIDRVELLITYVRRLISVDVRTKLIIGKPS